MIDGLAPFELIGISIAFFMLGLVGVLARRNLIFILISVEIMLNGIALLFVGAGAKWGQPEGQLMVLYLLVMAAIEVAIGLALFLRVSAYQTDLDPDQLQELNG